MIDDKENIIWKALSDPTRRMLLDILHSGPKTTGELSERFKMTRFGIMKHLKILEDAGLLIVKREGKYRWNHLNVTPIQTIYERWVKPFEGLWAEKALNLKNIVEKKGEYTMPNLNSIQVEVEITINKSKQHVWDAIINETGSWWHKDFYAIENSKIILEAFAGGRLYEKADNGNEGLWYVVSAIYPADSIEFVGHLRPEYGGPATSLLKLSLSENNQVTTLRISDSLFGVVDEANKQSVDSGWKLLFTDGLKKYLEEK